MRLRSSIPTKRAQLNPRWSILRGRSLLRRNDGPSGQSRLSQRVRKLGHTTSPAGRTRSRRTLPVRVVSRIGCSDESITCGSGIVAAFLSLDQIADIPNGSPEHVKGAGFGFAQVRLDLSEELLNWVKIRTVRGQKTEPGAALLQTLRGFLTLVHRQVVGSPRRPWTASEQAGSPHKSRRSDGSSAHRSPKAPSDHSSAARRQRSGSASGRMVPLHTDAALLRQRPRRRVILVEVPVSSRNTSRCGSWRMRGWRFVCQCSRA